LTPEAFPQIHGEESGGAVKNWRQRTHQSGNHYRHHQSAHA
jgi:hypothetical protein